MKFCKNLQRVVDISDPEWAPYWTNYKMLKKLIKELPSLVPLDDGKSTGNEKIHSDSAYSIFNGTTISTTHTTRQNRGDKTGENTEQQNAPTHTAPINTFGQTFHNTAISPAAERSSSASSHLQQQQEHQSQNPHDTESIGKSPGEVAFFKLLHSEFKKASHFFDRATEEFTIREERVREGMEIMRQPNSIMVNEKWGLMAKSIYRLYKDLLLLETFAIMTYCSFSKILKKHDKVTGYETKNAFMANIVNKANFTHYPKVLGMITRCERFYEEVSVKIRQEGNEGLYEDERLFINMIHRLNEQVLGSADSAPAGLERQQDGTQRRIAASNAAVDVRVRSHMLSPATSTLRNLLEENAKESHPTQSTAIPSSSLPLLSEGFVVSEEANNGEDGDDNDSDIVHGPEIRTTKRTRIS